MAGTPVARVLSRAVDVRPAEVPGLVAAFAYHFLLFTAYYILRPIRDSMGVAGGVENLDDLFGWTLIGMLLAVPLFGWFSGRFRRAVFLPWTYLFFVAQLVGVLGAVHRARGPGRDRPRVLRVGERLQPVRDRGVLELHGGPVRQGAGQAAVCVHHGGRERRRDDGLRRSRLSSRSRWAR